MQDKELVGWKSSLDREALPAKCEELVLEMQCFHWLRVEANFRCVHVAELQMSSKTNSLRMGTKHT